ncbi:MAG: lamin tail domain-containing protein [Patescibacteria group bacterium]
MIYINEWLPNPVGKDASGEFAEIFNSGKEAVNLSGWYLKATAKTKFVLSGEIRPGGFLVFKKPELKISLGNTDGQLFLYNVTGKQVDYQQFLGSAPEGKSFSRTLQDFSEKNLGGQAFFFSEPTPGVQNKFLEKTALMANNYQTGVPLNKNLGFGDFFGLLLGSSVVLTGLIFFVVKKHEDLSKLFFGRDEEVWS